MPNNAPNTLRKPMMLTHYIDTNMYHDFITDIMSLKYFMSSIKYVLTGFIRHRKL